MGSSLSEVPLYTCLRDRCKLSPDEASHSLWCYMMTLGVIMEADDALELLRHLVCIIGAGVVGVLCTLASGAWLHASIRRDYHLYTIKRHAPEVVEILESPLPTRSARLMSTESHRRMAESIRARRRGGKRRYGSHRRVSTRIYNPSAEHHCGYACVLKARGVVPTCRRIYELRCATAEAVYHAYIEDVHVQDMSVREMVQDTDMSLHAYLAGVRWRLWASPIEVCLAAQIQQWL